MNKVSIKDDHPAIARKFNPGDEQAFKTAMIRAKRLLHPGRTYFEVENEEKEPGFTDTIEVFENQRSVLQPLFYRRNRQLDIRIIAWSVPDNAYWVFRASDVLAVIKAHAKDLRVSIRGGVMI